MTNNNSDTDRELPSKGKLIRSTILAIFIAAVILITVVLPAEYGIDPTGVGSAIGLLKMGEIKVSLAQEASMEQFEVAGQEKDIRKPEIDTQKTEAIVESDSRNDMITITLIPNEGKEIKLTMSKGSTVNYTWYTDGGKANFDAHADSKKLMIDYHNYEKGKLQKSEGTMEAAFDGNHGWFWRNRTSETMTVTLEVSGNYTDVIRY